MPKNKLLIFLVYYSMNLIDAIVAKKFNNIHFTFIEIEEPPYGKRKRMLQKNVKKLELNFFNLQFCYLSHIVFSFVATEP